MKRFLKRAAVFAAMFLGPPAAAATIQQDIAFSANPQDGVMLMGRAFDPSLGSLESVTAVVSGTNVPSLFFSPPPPLGTFPATFPFVLDYQISAGGVATNEVTGQLGTYNLNYNPLNAQLTGPSEPFSFSEIFPVITSFIGSPYTISDQQLADFDVFTPPSGNIIDLSLYAGQVQLTYAYVPVPEPTSLGVLAVGIGLLPFLRQRAMSYQNSIRFSRKVG